MKNFYDRVYEVTRKIPYGRVTSYGAIARYLGSAGSSRMVGWAMKHSLDCTEFVPAHRVVNATGLLTGKMNFGGTRVMEELLENEGISIKNDRVIDFKIKFWDPVKELGTGY